MEVATQTGVGTTHDQRRVGYDRSGRREEHCYQGGWDGKVLGGCKNKPQQIVVVKAEVRGGMIQAEDPQGAEWQGYGWQEVTSKLQAGAQRWHPQESNK